MADPKRIVVFAEDRGHEEFLRAVIDRCAQEVSLEVEVRVQSARGGQGRALNELGLFQQVLLNSMSGIPLPDLIVVGIDTNCEGLIVVRQKIRNALDQRLSERTVIASPDPHVEIWYLSDSKAFAEAVGPPPGWAGRNAGKIDTRRSWRRPSQMRGMWPLSEVSSSPWKSSPGSTGTGPAVLSAVWDFS
jgi:hypothetical protein